MRGVIKMILFIGGLCLGCALGVIIMEALNARNDDEWRGHP